MEDIRLILLKKEISKEEFETLNDERMFLESKKILDMPLTREELTLLARINNFFNKIIDQKY